MGVVAYAHPGLDEQIADLTRRIATSPQDAHLYLERGEVHRIHCDWAAARQDFDHAQELEPGLTEVDLARGRMLLDADRVADAAAPLERYVATNPGDPEGLALLARVRIAQDRPLEGAALLDRAIADLDGSRGHPEYYLARARALAAAGPAHVDDAIAGLDEGLVALDHPVTLELLAIEIEEGRGRHAAALTRVDRLAAAAERKETWLIRRGEILETAGRFDEARASYRDTLKAIDSLPARRRANPAVTRLVDEATTALERLDGMHSETARVVR